MIANVSIAKLDGGYLIICGEKMAIKTDIKDALIQVKQWIEKPPFLFKEKIADLFGFDTKDKENKESPDWVSEILK
jgi:hypothetical protein